MKTIQQHLNELKEPYRTQAINNTDKETLQDKVEDLAFALKVAFLWSNSPEKHGYWGNVHSQIGAKNKKYFEIQSS